MKSAVAFIIPAVAILSAAVSAYYWFNIRVSTVQPETEIFLPPDLPSSNKRLLSVIAADGQHLAPTYKEVVCTEMLINALERLVSLSKTEKKDIRIITNDDLGALVMQDAPVIRGVQTALVKSGRGSAVLRAADVLPGDLVQLWDVCPLGTYGHCGIVISIEPSASITLYSSHPLTNGFGRQTFPWPDRAYFVRLH